MNGADVPRRDAKAHALTRLCHTEDDQVSMEESARLILGSNPVQQHYINEMLTRALADNVMRLGQTVLDVGANRGFHAFSFAEAVGDSGLVHAFEPNPVHWPDLAAHRNIRLWPYAVGDRHSVETFYFPKDHDGAASLHDPRDFLGADWKVDVLTAVQVRIDDLPEISSRKASFVKIDVERHELEALTGMRRLLERDRPIVVLENATPPIKAFFTDLSYRSAQLTALAFPEQDTGLPNTAFLPHELDDDRWLPHPSVILETVRASRLPPITV